MTNTNTPDATIGKPTTNNATSDYDAALAELLAELAA